MDSHTGMGSSDLPKTMKALRYSAPKDFSVVELPLPELKDDEVLVKISACGICGTDLHFHNGEFLAKFPLIPGHEAVGEIITLGPSAPPSLTPGTRVVIDPLLPCAKCPYCLSGNPLLCSRITGYGSTEPGAMSQFTAYPSHLVHPIPDSLPDLEAVLIEPASCALHGVERAGAPPGARGLIFGAGPTGILLAQLLRLNGVAHLTVASLPGPKLDFARKRGFGDEFVEISAEDPEGSFEALKKREAMGFDLVVEATGSAKVLEGALGFVRKGGKLLIYGVYGEKARVTWAPSRIWEDEITVLASFCSTNKFPAVLEYVRAGRLELDGIVDRTFAIEDWDGALEAVRRADMVKGAIVF